MTTDARLFSQPKPKTFSARGRFLIIVGVVIVGFTLLLNSPTAMAALASPASQAQNAEYEERLVSDAAQWKTLHAYLETVPAPTVVCFTNPYTDVDWQDHFYYEATPDVSSQRNRLGCTNLKDADLHFSSTAEYLDSYYEAIKTPHYTTTTLIDANGVKTQFATYPTELMNFNDAMRTQYALMLLTNTPYEQL